jgi:hypothetical protein
MNQNPTVVFVAPRTAVVEEHEIPSPKAGELLIRTRCTLISTDTEVTVDCHATSLRRQ